MQTVYPNHTHMHSSSLHPSLTHTLSLPPSHLSTPLLSLSLSLSLPFIPDIQLMLGGIAVMILAQIVGLSYGTIPEFWRYITSVVMMYAIGYPIGHTAVLGAFSKIQKSGDYL